MLRFGIYIIVIAAIIVTIYILNFAIFLFESGLRKGGGIPGGIIEVVGTFVIIGVWINIVIRAYKTITKKIAQARGGHADQALMESVRGFGSWLQSMFGAVIGAAVLAGLLALLGGMVGLLLWLVAK